MGLRRVMAPVYVWVPEGPLDPGWGVTPPTDPGYGRPGWSPADPDYGLGAGLHPGHGLPWAPGHPDQGLPVSPGHPSGGPIKPPGRPIVPSNPIYKPPAGHPWLPGHWEILDPGWGKPPILGFLPSDPGFGIPETPEGPGGGTWVPVDPDYGLPERCPGGKPHPPLWAWIPEPPDLTKPVEPVEPTPAPK